MSGIVPITVVKGAGAEFIPIPGNSCATVADFHTTRTQTTESPTHITSGFYKITPGTPRTAIYDYEESKYVLNGQIDILVSSPRLLPREFHVYTQRRNY